MVRLSFPRADQNCERQLDVCASCEDHKEPQGYDRRAGE